MSPFDRRWAGALWTIVRWGLAIVFIYAGLMKVRDAASFAASIARFQILPDVLVNAIALGLPPLEILCGAALLAGPWKRQAAFGVAFLCMVFLGALASAAARGIAVECTCFGAAEPEPIWKTLVRDVVLLTAALALYARCLRPAEACEPEAITSPTCAK
ncbi:MAG TPA: MauE/DoxX family redox-associated membrane protein [Chthoniobacteraceae bacterium]|nr:MauE/DoxX family redox-associated membrane protein [Chthoniobacteraceae bacterium]